MKFNFERIAGLHWAKLHGSGAALWTPSTMNVTPSVYNLTNVMELEIPNCPLTKRTLWGKKKTQKKETHWLLNLSGGPQATNQVRYESPITHAGGLLSLWCCGVKRIA